jgi:hypothetical protein
VFHDERRQPLPVPTLEQTGRFAEHVADNHNWYKHLPFFPPGALFVFFPNPHAGRGVRADGERFVVSDIEQGDYFAHHGRLPTADYLARFGHWDYWVDDNPRVLDPQPGPWLYSADGSRRELLADVFKREWSCRLTAFLKPALPMFDLRANELRREADVFMASGRQSVGRRLLNLFGGSAKDPVARRYRAAAPALRRATDTPVDAALYAFMESEARAQRDLVLRTLQRVRTAWTSSPLASAEPLAGSNKNDDSATA